jgi:hypothetical protein
MSESICLITPSEDPSDASSRWVADLSTLDPDSDRPVTDPCVVRNGTVLLGFYSTKGNSVKSEEESEKPALRRNTVSRRPEAAAFGLARGHHMLGTLAAIG